MTTDIYNRFDPTSPPPPLMTGESDSFAYRTMTTRFPGIIDTVLSDHAGIYPESIVQSLQQLRTELVTDQPLRRLETTAPDAGHWHEVWTQHRQYSWLNAPWYLAEAFFYRHLLEASGYYGNDEWRERDPFLPRKREELSSATAWNILEAALTHSAHNNTDSLAALLSYCVWGNRIDLSYTQVVQATGAQISLEHEAANLLVDDTDVVVRHLAPWNSSAQMDTRVDFICDNAGTELLTDLVLADFLLRFDWARQVVLHVKAHPTYVSDATLADIEWTIQAMQERQEQPCLALAERLESYQANKRLVVRSDYFWTSSSFFWEFPSVLRDELAKAHLVVIKGDANYRRLLGDSRWDTTVAMANAVPYFPAPFVALRTLKSDPIVGLQAGQADFLTQIDREWRVNGKRGVVQAVLSK